MNLSMLNKILKPLKDRVAMMLAKGLLEAVSDEKAMQLIKLSMYEGEVQEDIEHVHSYGLSSNCPSDGGEVVVGCIGGNRDSAIALVVGNSKYRVRNLKSGEVALYSKFGQKILLKEDGSIEISPASGKDMILTSNLQVQGTISCDDDISSSGDVKAGIISLKSHVHPGTAIIPTVGGVAGTNEGLTGGPQ